MSDNDKLMLPANMPTISHTSTMTMWYPHGVFGECQCFETLQACLAVVGNGIYVLEVCK